MHHSTVEQLLESLDQMPEWKRQAYAYSVCLRLKPGFDAFCDEVNFRYRNVLNHDLQSIESYLNPNTQIQLNEPLTGYVPIHADDYQTLHISPAISAVVASATLYDYIMGKDRNYEYLAYIGFETVEIFQHHLDEGPYDDFCPLNEQEYHRVMSDLNMLKSLSGELEVAYPQWHEYLINQHNDVLSPDPLIYPYQVSYINELKEKASKHNKFLSKPLTGAVTPSESDLEHITYDFEISLLNKLDEMVMI